MVERIADFDYGEKFAQERRKASRSYLYRDNRDIATIESMMDTQYLFESILLDIVSGTKNRPLEILDSGCGEGNTLRDIVDLANKWRIETRTTGITLDPKHLEKMRQNQINEILIGPAEYFLKEEEFRNKFDFLIDFYGAGFYNSTEVLDLYPNIIAPNGRALLTLPGLDLTASWAHAHLASKGLEEDSLIGFDYRFMLYKKPGE